MKERVLVTLGGILLLTGSLMMPARAQESSANPEIEKLKAQLAAQQEQIDQLRRAMDEEKKALEEASRPKPPSLGQVASTTPVVPAGEAEPVLHPGLAAALSPLPPEEPQPSPLQIHLGTATITPIGFMDMTGVFRSKDGGSSIGTNFGSVPYSNAALGNLSEIRFSAQNSRIGARVDADVHGAHVIGYWESDFLGTQGTNAAVTSNPNSFRIRLYWVDVQKGQWEILGGQSWSLLTPGRQGISPLPQNIYYSQDMDTNYQVGLSWTRAPQFRVVYHPSDAISWAFALEESEQYGGGSGGAGTITIPSLLATNYANQVDTGTQTFNVPNLTPDIQTKIAFDPKVDGKLMHVEFGGMLSTFKTYNGTQSFTTEGGAGEANFNLQLANSSDCTNLPACGLHLIINSFISDGGGRYLFGEAPDIIIRPNGAPSPVHADGFIGGFEHTTPSKTHPTTFYAYYGADLIGRDVSIDTTNKNALVGYGFAGSGNSANRTIQEATFGLTQTFWKNPNYGALSMIFQYSYLFRNPWAPSTTAGAPRNTNDNMVWVDLRYTLPGQAPTYK